MNTVLDGKKSQGMYYDVVIVGAGPYGLSTAAHMQERGLHVAIFGKPLHLWREHMPKGMFLRSYWWATNLSDPHKRYDLEHYFQEKHIEPFDPLPADMFIQYGLWFQKHVIPNVDETYVAAIERKDGPKERNFTVTLVDGRVVYSRALIMAPGLYYYPHLPTEYTHISSELVSHTSDHHTFECFSGKQIVVIGGGQSAMETSALAYESGAQVHLISRSPLVWIREDGSFPKNRPLLTRLRSPKAGISAGWFNWRLEHFPYVFQRLSRTRKDELMRGRGRYGPMSAAWLRPRVEGKVIIHELQCVQEITEVDDGLQVTLSNSKVLKADHIVLGTGYRVDVSKLPMIDSSLLPEIRTYQGAPVLNNYFESSVSGMYFIGFSSVSSCGPLYRFVLGTDAAAKRVADAVARQTRQLARAW